MTIDELKAALKAPVETKRAAWSRLRGAEGALVKKARDNGGVAAVRDLADNVRVAYVEFRDATNAVDAIVYAAPTDVQHQLTMGDLQ